LETSMKTKTTDITTNIWQMEVQYLYGINQ